MQDDQSEVAKVLTGLRSRDGSTGIDEGQTRSLEQSGLSRCILGIAKIAESNANQAEALLRT